MPPPSQIMLPTKVRRPSKSFRRISGPRDGESGADAVAQAQHQKVDGIGGANPGQGLVTQEVAHHHGVHHGVELLEQETQQKRHHKRRAEWAWATRRSCPERCFWHILNLSFGDGIHILRRSNGFRCVGDVRPSEKSLPLGVVPRAANRNIHDCRWQSYRYYAGAAFVATDEVETSDYHHRLVRRCYLRPHPSWALAHDTFPPGKAFGPTGSHLKKPDFSSFERTY